MGKSVIKLMVCGSRTIVDRDFIYKTIDECIAEKFPSDEIIIIEGEARGVDSIAKQWAIDHNKQIEAYPANWDLYGKSAGFRRNVDMVKACDYCLIIWDGKSKGTKHDIVLCTQYKKPYTLTKENTNENQQDN